MSNTKISGLTSATTPLAGTEVLPIVQSSTTKKVAVSDLTAGRAVSVGTLAVGTGNSSLKIESNGANNFQIYNGALTQDGTNYALAQNYTGANTAINAASGGQILYQIGGVTRATFDANYNLIFNVASKGINFTANTPAAGKTSQLLNWYEEGTWTPVLSASTPGNFTPTYTTQEASYTRIGRTVVVIGRIYLTSFTNTTGSGDLFITGLPFTASGYYAPGSLEFAGVTKVGYTQFTPFATPGQTYLRIDCSSSATAVTTLQVTDLTAGGRPYFVFQVTYQV